jgi:tight adherence protein F
MIGGVMSWLVLKKRISAFTKNGRGSVMVEMGFYSIIFFALCMLLLDFNNVFINKGQLERVNNSLANVLRERSRFYNDRIELYPADVENLSTFAGKLLESDNLGRDYLLIVDVLTFEGESSENKSVKLAKSFTSGPAKTCDLTRPDHNTLSLLSAWNSDSFAWLPVYQVTLCVPGGENMLKKALGTAGITMRDLSVSNAVVPR